MELDRIADQLSFHFTRLIAVITGTTEHQQLIAEGSSKLASVPSGGAAPAASSGGAAAAGGAAEPAAEEKKEEAKEGESIYSRDYQ